MGVMKNPTLGNTFVQQFLRTVHATLLCVQKSATDRPTTSNNIRYDFNAFQRHTMTLPTPNTPAFVIGRVDAKSTSGESKEKDCSVNNMTITVVQGRY
ncbi:G-type lectin S-receptor-like serine/threonine-protein kinase, partial [Tanacetum coccineum]